MVSRKKTIYVPVLRMKMGELDGLRSLQNDIADCIAPMLVVPPAKERKSSSQESLFAADRDVPDVGGVLSRYWRDREVFIDPRALFKECGVDTAISWLPSLFSRARSQGVLAVPVASLGELERMGVDAFKSAVAIVTGLKFGLRIESGDLTDPSLDDRVRKVLKNMDVSAEKCAVFADFSDADLSDPALVSPIIRAALEQLQMLGRWYVVVFLGTNYPEKNPAEPGQTITQPRNEWHAWSDAVKFDPSTAEHMVFGDFAADCSKMAFGGNGGRPIPHTRYTTASSWLVVRGDSTGSTHEVMKNVFERIVASGSFAGPTFSAADAYIFDVARNNAPSAGNATIWRQLNTTHHITQVVADIAKVRRIRISRLPSAPAGMQQAILYA
ncbi:beta family protein [Azohydromonas aeria]|uniref:beta family protein n=1 Tax=Azohydromonas aeria TaxID=2590212 RepID=UPI0012FCBEDF|nr:beta family protein [Azohydromonas aeria]